MALVLDYNFVTMDEMKKAIGNNEFIEHAEFSGNCYGTRYIQMTHSHTRLTAKLTYFYNIVALKYECVEGHPNDAGDLSNTFKYYLNVLLR